MTDDRFLLADFIGRRNWPTSSFVWHPFIVLVWGFGCSELQAVQCLEPTSDACGSGRHKLGATGKPHTTITFIHFYGNIHSIYLYYLVLCFNSYLYVLLLGVINACASISLHGWGTQWPINPPLLSSSHSPSFPPPGMVQGLTGVEQSHELNLNLRFKYCELLD